MRIFFNHLVHSLYQRLVTINTPPHTSLVFLRLQWRALTVNIFLGITCSWQQAKPGLGTAWAPGCFVYGALLELPKQSRDKHGTERTLLGARAT